MASSIGVADGATHRRRRVVWSLGLVLLVGPAWMGVSAGHASPDTPRFARVLAAPGDVGWEGPSFEGSSGSPSGSKPESKLWFNDGKWWATLFDTASGDFFIHYLDVANQTWVKTPSQIDARSNSRADALWNGTKLFVASHAFSDGSTSTGSPGLLYRYSYSSGPDTYSLDPGFPVTINDVRSETLVIDQDSAGRLWATWRQADEVYVSYSTVGGASWSTPAPLPVSGVNVSGDDISSVVAFGGNQIGILWSNQDDEKMYFAHRLDSASPTSWSSPEVAYSGSNSADDHINLKSVHDENGRILAAVKTSRSGSSALVHLLDRDPSSGAWSSHTFGLGSDNHTRPVVVVDSSNDEVHLFAASGQSGGSIYEKSAPLDNISFAPGVGTAILTDADSDDINNPTSTKQNVTTDSGLVVLATNDTTREYWTHYDDLNGGSTTTTTTSTTTSTTTTTTTTTTTSTTTSTTMEPSGPSAPGGVVAEPGDGRVLLRWTAATPGSSPITGYRVTATPALGGSGFVDFGVGSPGVEQVVSVPNYVERVFHVAALGGVVGPATSSLPVMPVGWLPFSSSDAFADQQVLDFSGSAVVSAGVRDDVRSRFVESGQPASQVVAEVFLAAPEWAGDNDGQAARVTRLYFAYFLRPPDRGGMDYWVRAYQGGRSLERISQSFATSSEFVRRYGALDDEQFLELAYRNLFDRDPDPGGRAYWLRKLGQGLPRGSMMTKFSESSEYRRISKDQVYVSLVYRALYGRPPSPAELAVELAKPDAGVARTITDILASSRYRQRAIL